MVIGQPVWSCACAITKAGLPTSIDPTRVYWSYVSWIGRSRGGKAEMAQPKESVQKDWTLTPPNSIRRTPPHAFRFGACSFNSEWEREFPDEQEGLEDVLPEERTYWMERTKATCPIDQPKNILIKEWMGSRPGPYC